MTVDAAFDALHAELLATHHTGRILRMLALGRSARGGDQQALAHIDRLAAGDVFERRLALYAIQTLGDGARLLPFTEDIAATIRALAFTMVPRVCDDDQALAALQIAYALRRDRDLLRELARRRRRPVIDRYLDWLSLQPGLHDFADLVPWATTAGVLRHLDRALARPSAIFWGRLARLAPAALARVLGERLRAVPGEPDALTRQRIDRHLREIAEGAPDEALGLLELLFSRGILAHVGVLRYLGQPRPAALLRLIEAHDLRPGDALLARGAADRTPAELARVVRRDPHLLGDASELLKKLRPAQIDAVVDAWCEVMETNPRWGFALLDRIPDPARRLAAYQCWSVAVRDWDGVIQKSTVARLPVDLRELEARRHIHEVVAFGTRPLARAPYASFLPWDEALEVLRPLLGFPEGEARGVALATLLAIPGNRPDEPALVDRALEMVIARKHEQDPVRLRMLRALAAWPRQIWRAEHFAVIARILRDTLDAGDLSGATAQAAELLLLRTFRLDPKSGARWLGTFLKERGHIGALRLGDHLDADEVRLAAPQLLALARRRARQELDWQVITLVWSLGPRKALVDGLDDLLLDMSKRTPWSGTARELFELLEAPRQEAELPATLERWWSKGWQAEILALADRPQVVGGRQPPPAPLLLAAVERIARGEGRDHEVIAALALLRVRACARFDAILGELLRADPSYVWLPLVHWHLHIRRQDLLGHFLGDQVIHGRFATGRSAWVLPFERGFWRWTPAQNTTFAGALAQIVGDHERDTPTVWRALTILAAIDSGPVDALAAAASDSRAAVMEKAIRVMARCDRGQCVPTLIECLADERARFAIYGLRRALKDLLPRRAVELLMTAPLRKVTVAKEVVRLLGEQRIDAAYDHLIGLWDGDIHRDVRIALLRALWDHLDRDPTWRVYAKAVAGDDWVMASRLGDIPADRLTVESDRRLSGLLARVLERPEPEARIDLLQRAARLAVADPERTFLRACASRLVSIFDDEVAAAMAALRERSTEADMEALPDLLRGAMEDARCLHVAIGALLSVEVRTRAVWIGAAKAAAEVLAVDPRFAGLRIRCAAAAMSGRELGELLLSLADDGLLEGDVLSDALRAIEKIGLHELAAATARFADAASPAARRLALAALLRDVGDRGWTEGNRERLAALQADPSPLVAGAALAIFPPREMVKDAEPRAPA
ncbi:MAG: hypothetical protein H6710_20095 [Myxococcales bacterium]|nr:hypothetical protein [Myxococcales bacterium]